MSTTHHNHSAVSDINVMLAILQLHSLYLGTSAIYIEYKHIYNREVLYFQVMSCGKVPSTAVWSSPRATKCSMFSILLLR